MPSSICSGRHAGVGQAQRVLAALEQEVGALDEQHVALGRGLLELGHVDRLGQLHPHEVAALGARELRLGQLALERGDDRVAAVAQRVLDRRDRAVHAARCAANWLTIDWATMFGEMYVLVPSVWICLMIACGPTR